MNLKIKPFVPRSVTIASLVVLMVMMMFNADFLYHKAFAFSVTPVNNTNATTSITYGGGQTFVGSDAANLIEVWQSGAKVGTVAATDPFLLHYYNGRVYSFDKTGLTVSEYNPVSGGAPIFIRTSSAFTSCTSSGDPRFDNDKFFCVTGASNTVKTMSLSTFTINTSATVNAGATPCNVPIIGVYDSANDRMFLDCSTSGNIAVAEGWTASATPDYSVAHIANINDMLYDPATQKLIGCENAGTRIWIYDAPTGAAPTLSTTITVTSTADCQEDSIRMDSTGRALVWMAGEITVIDMTSETVLTTFSVTESCSAAAGACDIANVNANTFVTTTNTANYYVIDLTGVPQGGEGGGIVGASVCYVDKNFDGVADYIFNDVGGPDGFPTVGHPDAGVPDGMCDWSGFGTTTPPVITETTEILICLAGIIPCNNGQPVDPDPQTNGIGYLLVIFLLAVMIALFGVAQMRLGLGIPDWLWMIGTFAVIGFATLVGWIDSTLFIIGAVIVAALGAVSFIKKFAGGF